MSGSRNLVGVFKHHFSSQLRGSVPYQKGFIVIGKLPVHRREYAGPSMNNQALQAAAPGVAAADQARERVGGNGQPRIRRTTGTKRKSSSSGRASSKKKAATSNKGGKKTKKKPTTASKRPRKEAI